MPYYTTDENRATKIINTVLTFLPNDIYTQLNNLFPFNGMDTKQNVDV